MMITTAIESPFSGDPARNARYLAWCLKDCYDRGEAAYAGHALGPLAYPEYAEFRAHGMEADLAMALVCDQVAYYLDLGWSPGMQHNQELRLRFITVERVLQPESKAAFDRGEWPPGATMRLVPAEEA
jgi:hypothetical protein